jgi:hypothetical protein
MKQLMKAIPFAGILALSGCVTLDKAVRDIQTATIPAPATVNEPLPQICQAAKDNRIRANDFYSGKAITISGEVVSITEGFQPHYRVLMKAGKINVHAGTENQFSVKQLTVGRPAYVTGTITDVTYDFYGCSVALKDSRF